MKLSTKLLFLDFAMFFAFAGVSIFLVTFFITEDHLRMGAFGGLMYLYGSVIQSSIDELRKRLKRQDM